jgi:glycosyltransferase involved in cell wall biosynthesis
MQEGGKFRPLLLVSNGSGAAAQRFDFPVLALPMRPLVGAEDGALQPVMRLAARLPLTLYQLYRLLHSQRITVVNCIFPDTECIYFMLLKRLRLYRGKIIAGLHGNEIKYMLARRGLPRKLSRWLMANADAVVSCSYGLQADLLRLAPECAGKAHVIYNGIDVPRFTARRPSPTLDSLGGRPFILNIGKFEHKKGQDVLIRSFEMLAPAYPDLLLVMAGAPGPEIAQIADLVQGSSVAPQIRMLKNVPHDDIPGLLNSARLFVLPSRREGFPIVLLEAGACCTPVIAAACIGVPEIIKDGETGRLVPVDDAAALARAISDLLQNESERMRMAKALHDLVSTRFTWEAAYEDYVRL